MQMIFWDIINLDIKSDFPEEYKNMLNEMKAAAESLHNKVDIETAKEFRQCVRMNLNMDYQKSDFWKALYFVWNFSKNISTNMRTNIKRKAGQCSGRKRREKQFEILKEIVEPLEEALKKLQDVNYARGYKNEIIVDVFGTKWKIHSTKSAEPGAFIGMSLNPEDIHIMHKSDNGGISFSAPESEVSGDENKF